MKFHLFQDGDSDVFALTTDRRGHNLPSTQESEWRFLETLDPVKFACGEENFGDVHEAIAATGFYLFEGEMQPLPAAEPKPQPSRGKRRRRVRP